MFGYTPSHIPFKTGILVSTQPIVFDFTAQTMSVYGGHSDVYPAGVMVDNRWYKFTTTVENPYTTISIALDGNSLLGKIYFNTESGLLSAKRVTDLVVKQDILIGFYHLMEKSYSLFGDINQTPAIYELIDTVDTGQLGMLLSDGVPAFDFTANTLTIPKRARLLYKNKLYTLDDGVNDVVVNISVTYTFGVVLYDVDLETFIVRDNESSGIRVAKPSEVVIATFFNNSKKVTMIGDYLVDGLSSNQYFNQYLNVERTWAYTDYNKNITIENTNSTIRKVYLKFDTLRIVGFNGGALKDVTWETLHTDINNAEAFETSPSGVLDCLAIPSAYMLVFNVVDKKVELIHRELYYPEKHIMLLNSALGFAVGGALLLTKTFDEVTNIKTQLAQLSQTDATSTSYTNEIAEVKIKLAKTGNNDFNYIAISDLHNWRVAYRPALLRQLKAVVEIANTSNIDFVAVLGDLIEINNTKDEAIALMLQITNELSKCNKPVIFSYGNHDFNSYNQLTNVPLNMVVTPAEYYNICVSPFGNDNANGKLYYFKDFHNKSTRVVNLQYSDITINENGDGTCNITGNLDYSNAQIKWLSETLKNTPNDWKVIILSHGTFIDEANLHYSSTSNSLAIVDLINSFNNKTVYVNESLNIDVDFIANANSKVIINNYGHIHVDLLAKATEADIVLISTGTSSEIWGSTGEGKFGDYTTLPYTESKKIYDGTVNEALFDIISVSETEVKRIRFGVGEDAIVSL